jgi:5-oxoprolinase (ATP-hydrolysing)
MSIAEDMGQVLAGSARSVNIRERLDFSCALFDAAGRLIANAPHIPVHLGSMGDAVRALLERFKDQMRPGDAWLINSPYAGGTHLPDITVVMPGYDTGESTPRYFTAARAHHADVGGIAPGSMPAMSRRIAEEGCLSEGMPILRDGVFLEDAVRAWLTSPPLPARNPEQNIADLKAQVAACHLGLRLLAQFAAEVGEAAVLAYMGFVQDYAEAAVRRLLPRLRDGRHTLTLDGGARITVSVHIDRAAGRAVIDFTGTSPQQAGNLNAPASITRSAVLYVFRTLIDEDLPLNAGVLRPLEIRLPAGSLLDPAPPAAVVAGNVETSQNVVDALYAALGVMAAGQGSMNNLSFGDGAHQYYETVCGGTGAGMTPAGLGFPGADAVHCHMTNSRLTDPEVLELNLPVRVERFAIRRGSGGRGRWRGGDGVVRALRFLAPMQGNLLALRREVAPFGLAGGGPGLPGRQWIERADGTMLQLPGIACFDVQSGDLLVLETPGGGGYGKEDPT